MSTATQRRDADAGSSLNSFVTKIALRRSQDRAARQASSPGVDNQTSLNQHERPHRISFAFLRGRRQADESRKKALSTSSYVSESKRRLSMPNALAALSLSPSMSSNESKEFKTDFTAVTISCGAEETSFYPGQSIRCQVSVDADHLGAGILQSVSVRARGSAQIPRFDFDQSLKQVVRPSRYTFFDSGTQTITREQLLGECLMKDGQTIIPFQVALPQYCFSFNSHSDPERRSAPLPPSLFLNTMHEDDSHISRGTILDKLQKLAPIFCFEHSEAPVASVQYYLTVKAKWRVGAFLQKTTKTYIPFIVRKAPVHSSSISNSISNPHQRRSLDLPRQRRLSSNVAFNGGLQRESMQETFLRLHPQRGEECFDGGRGAHRDRQMDIVLVETPRGPQAWHVWSIDQSEGGNDEAVQAEFSFPATAVVTTDRRIPFTLKTSHPKLRVDAASVRMQLVRSVTTSSFFGVLKLEDGKEMNDEHGVGSLRIFALKETIHPLVEPAPNDEYQVRSLAYFEPAKRGVEGYFEICSRWTDRQDLCTPHVQRHASRLRKEDIVHQYFQQRQDKLALIPSFDFRGLRVEYTIRLSFSLIHKSEANDANTHEPIAMAGSIEIKLASMGLVSGNSHEEARSDVRSILQRPSSLLAQRSTERTLDLIRESRSEVDPSRDLLAFDADSGANSENVCSATPQLRDHSSGCQMTVAEQHQSLVRPSFQRQEPFEPVGVNVKGCINNATSMQSRLSYTPPPVTHMASLASLRTTDGPAPPYIGTLQDV